MFTFRSFIYEAISVICKVILCIYKSLSCFIDLCPVPITYFYYCDIIMGLNIL